MNGKQKQVLIDYESQLSRNELADFLETIASKIREEGSFTFVQPTGDVRIDFPEGLKVEVEYEIENGEHEFEIEIEWREGAAGSTGKVEIL